MQDYNTIIGVIQMRQNNCTLQSIQDRYHIGSGTVQLILNRFNDSGFTLEQLKSIEPKSVEELFYPPENLMWKSLPMPDFQMYFDRIHAKGSKVNVSYCWMDYKSSHPDVFFASLFCIKLQKVFVGCCTCIL